MRRFLMCTLLGAFVLGLIGGPVSAAEEKEKKKRDPEAIFKKLDKNSDSKLTFDEVKGKKEGKKAEAAEKRFKAADKDKDGSLSLEEFKASLTKKKKKKDK